MKPLKVLMFGWEFPPKISGGLATACYGMLKSFSLNYPIKIVMVLPFATDENLENVEFINASEFPLKEHNIKLLENLINKLKKINPQEQYFSAYITPEKYQELIEKYKGALENEITKGKISITEGYGETLFQEIEKYGIIGAEMGKKIEHDIIHIHDWLTVKAGINAKLSSGKPLVMHVHATEFDRSGENINKKIYNIEKEGMMKADKIIAVSNYTKNIISTKYGINPAKIEVVHNGSNAFEFLNINSQKHVKEKIVTFLGRITMQKGPSYFIEAAKLVLQRTDNVRFIMAGTGDLTKKMLKYVASLGISNRFHFTGFLNPYEVRKLFKITDLYVMPSISEPFGITPLEAIQNGVPVILSKQSGVSEVLNYVIKVDFWDTHALADAIYNILNNNALHRMMKNLQEKEINNITWDKSTAKIIKLYYQLALARA